MCIHIYIMYIYHILFIDSSINGHLDFFHPLDILDNVAIGIPIQISL